MTRQASDGLPTGNRQDTDRHAVDVATAARRLGITPDAVRSRLHRGTLPGERFGNQWRVFLDPEPPPADDGDGQATGSRQDADRQDDGPLIAELRAQVADLREQLARRDAELERKDVLLLEVMRKIPDAGAILPAEVASAQNRQDAPYASPDGTRATEPPPVGDSIHDAPDDHPRSVFVSLWHRLRGRG